MKVLTSVTNQVGLETSQIHRETYETLVCTLSLLVFPKEEGRGGLKMKGGNREDKRSGQLSVIISFPLITANTLQISASVKISTNYFFYHLFVYTISFLSVRCRMMTGIRGVVKEEQLFCWLVSFTKVFFRNLILYFDL